MASAEGYSHIWALLSPGHEACLLISLQTLASQQADLGAIPNDVSVASGFYIAALVKASRIAEARKQLVKLAELIHLGQEKEWEFNEWCHGRTGKPMGYLHQAWSAGMYIFA